MASPIANITAPTGLSTRGLVLREITNVCKARFRANPTSLEFDDLNESVVMPQDASLNFSRAEDRSTLVGGGVLEETVLYGEDSIIVHPKSHTTSPKKRPLEGKVEESAPKRRKLPTHQEDWDDWEIIGQASTWSAICITSNEGAAKTPAKPLTAKSGTPSTQKRVTRRKSRRRRRAIKRKTRRKNPKRAPSKSAARTKKENKQSVAKATSRTATKAGKTPAHKTSSIDIQSKKKQTLELRSVSKTLYNSAWKKKLNTITMEKFWQVVQENPELGSVDRTRFDEILKNLHDLGRIFLQGGEIHRI